MQIVITTGFLLMKIEVPRTGSRYNLFVPLHAMTPGLQPN